MEKIVIPRVVMREKPSQKTKVVSEALFGEDIVVLKTMDDWTNIQTPDGYTGWIRGGFQKCGPYHPSCEVTRLSAHVYAEADTEFGPLFTLPFGAKLEVVDSSQRWLTIRLPDERVAFIQTGDVALEPFDLKKFLGIPYTWGGRCSFGFDCSGFVQMLYARLGIQLPRDACQQVALGYEVEVFIWGDLIFWGHSKTELKHVGMYLENGMFIHTSVRENRPYLRISSLNDAEWNGFGFYSYRTAKRLLGQNPKEKERNCNFCSNHHENAMKMPIDKNFDFVPPKGH